MRKSREPREGTSGRGEHDPGHNPLSSTGNLQTVKTEGALSRRISLLAVKDALGAGRAIDFVLCPAPFLLGIVFPTQMLEGTCVSRGSHRPARLPVLR